MKFQSPTDPARLTPLASNIKKINKLTNYLEDGGVTRRALLPTPEVIKFKGKS